MCFLSVCCRCGRKPKDVGARKKQSFQLTKNIAIDTKSIRADGACWEHEKAENEGIRGKFDSFVESTTLEVVVTTCVVADLTLTIITFVASEEVSESEIVFILSAVFLVVLIMDVILRAIKDGRKFFFRWLNWLEVFVALASAVMLLLDGIRRQCSGDGCSDGSPGKGASLGRAVRPLLRMIRVMRAASHLFVNRGGVVGKVDRLADKLVDEKIRKLIDKFMLCPSENIESKPSKGHFHIEKAQIRSRVFEHVHLPFTILGGLLDLAHVDIDLVKGRRADDDNTHHRLLVVVENAMIVIGPGHHQEEPAAAWTYQAVCEKKENIVNFIIGQIENANMLGSTKKKRQAASTENFHGKESLDAAGSLSSERSAISSLPSLRKMATKASVAGVAPLKKKSVNRLKSRFMQVVEEVLANGMHVSLRNIEIRYEDARGELTGGKQVVGGLEIGSVQLRALGVRGDAHHDEDEFRIKGKWRPGISAATPCLSEKDAGTGTKSSTSTKRLLRNGVRAAMHINRVAAFWDVCETNEAPVSVLYAPYLQESTNQNILSFLSECKSRRARERVRWAIALEAEKRLTEMEISEGRSGACMQERCRRLRDLVSAHRYIIVPCSGSVHGVYRPRQSAGSIAILPSSQDPDVEYAEREIRKATREVEEMIESLRKVDKMKAQELEQKFTRLTTDPETSNLQGLNDFWPPQTDIDVHIPRIPFMVDIAQARSLAELTAYVKRWRDEDNRYMWQTAFMGYAKIPSKQITSLRWGYALRQVLRGIDPKYPWNSLPWWEILRSAKFRRQYLEALTEDRPCEKKIARLQVALPLLEIYYCRKASDLTTDDRRKKRERNGSKTRLEASSSASADLEWGDTATLATNQSIETDCRAQSFNAVNTNYNQAKGELREELEEIKVPSSAKSLQFHLRVGQMQAYLMSPPQLQKKGIRRPLLRFEVGGMVMAAARHAPRKIWMQLAPPNAIVKALRGSGKAFEEVAAEVGVEDVRAVFCGMPSSATHLRRLVGAHRVHARRGDALSTAHLANMDNHLLSSFDPQNKASASFVQSSLSFIHKVEERVHSVLHHDEEQERSLRNSEPAYVDRTGSRFFDSRREERFFIQLRVAFLGHETQKAEDDVDSEREVPHWEFAAWTLPLEVNVCHPFMKQLAKNFKPREWVPRWLAKGNDVWQTMLKLRQQHDEKTVRRLKKKKRNELLMGSAGPLRERWLTGEVLFRGGARGSRYDTYTEATYLKRFCMIPKGTLKIERLVGLARLRVGFVPMREKNGPYASKDGWLFATECEALAADKLFQGGMVKEQSRRHDQRPEDAGCDAHEDPWYHQEVLFVLPEHVLRNWGVDPHDGSLRPRFRPPVSALGVRPPVPWRTSMGTRVLPGCPKELNGCSCSSLERNPPTHLRSAASALQSSMPETGSADWTSSNPTSRQCTTPNCPASSPPSAMLTEETRGNPLRPWTDKSTPPVTPAHPKSPSQLRGWAKAKHQEEEKSKPATPSKDQFRIDSVIEVVSPESLGLPPPSAANLHRWWRSLGIMLD